MAGKRASRRRPWQRELRERLLDDLEVIRRKLVKVDLVSGEPRQEIVDELETLMEDVAVTRCHRCGCSDHEACPGGCWWVSLGPPTCSSCV